MTDFFSDFTYWKSVFLNIFCPVLILHLVAPENMVWGPGPGPDPTWSLRIGFESKCIQNPNLDFFSHFLTNRVWSNQPKIYKWIMFKTLLCKKHHLKGMYDIPYERFWTMYVYSNKQNDEIINFNGQLWF